MKNKRKWHPSGKLPDPFKGADFRLDCPVCGGKMWLAPPCMGEEGFYLCRRSEGGCGYAELQSECHARLGG